MLKQRGYNVRLMCLHDSRLLKIFFDVLHAMTAMKSESFEIVFYTTLYIYSDVMSKAYDEIYFCWELVNTLSKSSKKKYRKTQN